MSDILEVFADTGQVIERDYTPEEAEQRAKDEAEAQTQKAEQAKQKAARDKVRGDAITHAKSLGFTNEMINVMYPTLVEE